MQPGKTIYGKGYKEVETALAKARGDAARDLFYHDENLKVGKYLERWLSDSVRDTVRQRTHEGYAHIVERHIVPTLGRVKLSKVTPAHVRSLYRERLDSGLSASTVQYIHTTLNKALKQAHDDGLIPRTRRPS